MKNLLSSPSLTPLPFLCKHVQLLPSGFLSLCSLIVIKELECLGLNLIWRKLLNVSVSVSLSVELK